jgi:hypothetical protein
VREQLLYNKIIKSKKSCKTQMHTHIEQHKKDNTKKHKLIQKKKDPDGSLKEAITYSGKFVTCIANKHASLPHSPISHCHTLDEP